MGFSSDDVDWLRAEVLRIVDSQSNAHHIARWRSLYLWLVGGGLLALGGFLLSVKAYISDSIAETATTEIRKQLDTRIDDISKQSLRIVNEYSAIAAGAAAAAKAAEKSSGTSLEAASAAEQTAVAAKDRAQQAQGKAERAAREAADRVRETLRELLEKSTLPGSELGKAVLDTISPELVDVRAKLSQVLKSLQSRGFLDDIAKRSAEGTWDENPPRNTLTDADKRRQHAELTADFPAGVILISLRMFVYTSRGPNAADGFHVLYVNDQPIGTEPLIAPLAGPGQEGVETDVVSWIFNNKEPGRLKIYAQIEKSTPDREVVFGKVKLKAICL